MTDRLRPRARRVYTVRWIDGRRRDVMVRYFARRYDAERFAAELRDAGKDPVIFYTRTDWRQQP